MYSFSAGDFYEEKYWRDFRVTVQEDGVVNWAYGGVVSSQCSLDITDYPFDTQTCKIILESFVYTSEDVVLQCFNPMVDTTGLPGDGMWKLKKTSCYTATSTKLGLEFSSLEYTLVYERKSTWFVYNIVLPCLLMVVLVLASFWLPPDSGEKIGMGITLLLSFSVFQLIVSDSIPRSSDYMPMLSMLYYILMNLYASFNI